MGWFSPFIYKNRRGKKFWLHMKQRGKGVLYFFSKNPEGAINDLPKGFTVIENEKTGLPLIKRKEAGMLDNILGGIGKKKETKEGEESKEGEEPKEEAPAQETPAEEK